MSAPASACATRDLRVEVERGVVVDLAVGRRATPQWPWSVYSSTHRSAHEHESSPTSSRRSRRATCTMPSGSQAPEPSASFAAGTPNRITAGHAQAGQLRDLLAQRLAGVLHDAGQRRDRLGLVMPSRTNSGAMRSSGPSRVSATMRRSAGVRRRRRRRRWGKFTPGLARRGSCRCSQTVVATRSSSQQLTVLAGSPRWPVLLRRPAPLGSSAVYEGPPDRPLRAT